MTTESAAVRPDAIAEALRASILAGHDAPGSALTEAAVAVRFGVARPTARIAIDRLVADGLLRREAHRAARVPELTRDDIVDLYDNRAVLESAAMARLAQSGTIPAAAVEAHRQLTAAAARTAPDDFADADIAFHRALVAAQPSARLARLHGLLMGEIELGIAQVQTAALIPRERIVAQHQAILDAVTAGDTDSAAALTREHIEGARDVLLQHLETDTHPSRTHHD